MCMFLSANIVNFHYCACKNFMCTQDMLGSLTEIGSVLHSIKAYHCEKHFRKRIALLVFECILKIKKGHTFQFLSVLLNTKILVKPNWH